MFGWLYNTIGSHELTKSQESFFSLTSGTKTILGMFGVAAILFGVGYALRPVEEVFDDLHDSRKDIRTLEH